VLDLETGERIKIDPPGDGKTYGFSFESSGTLLLTRGGVVSRWDPATQTFEVVVDEGVEFALPIGDGQRLYIRWKGTDIRSILNLEDGTSRDLPEAHQLPSYIRFDRAGSIAATSHPDGEIRVGPLFSEEPYVLLGHEPDVTYVYLSPDGRWVASLGNADGTIRLWPMPDLSKPALHTLPHDELMAKLKALTNMRAVPDPDSHDGYQIEADFTAYRGWETVPDW
jgi:WD40 repeat protein